MDLLKLKNNVLGVPGDKVPDLEIYEALDEREPASNQKLLPPNFRLIPTYDSKGNGDILNRQILVRVFNHLPGLSIFTSGDIESVGFTDSARVKGREDTLVSLNKRGLQ